MTKLPPLHTALLAALAVLAISSCGSGQAPGSAPHEMNVSGHEAAAQEHDEIAAAHAAKYEPTDEHLTRCAPKGLCWTSVRNPTAKHRRRAEEHKRMAADHRAGADALRTAEERACAGVPPEDRDMSPFAHTEDIARVEPLGEAGSSPRGAVVVFRHVQGMTVAELQRIVDCHLARNSAVGGEMKEMPYCPLVPKNVTAKVSERPDGIAVTVESAEPASAADALKRAQTLVAE